MATTPLMQMLQGYLKVASDRQQVVASNIANVDTPGYHARDINFQSAMQQVMNEGNNMQLEPASVEVDGLPERPDGNNVNVDRESMLLSETQLQYQMGVQLVKAEFHRLLSAIKELTMGLFDMMSISASALNAERQRAEVTSANLANADTTHTDTGGPFVRKEVVFSASNASPFRTVMNRIGRFGQSPAGSVQLTQVVNDTTPPVMRYEPGNPDADKSGFVAYPSINPVSEMVDLMGAVRAYQLNASAVGAAKQMIQQSLDILKSS